MYNIDFNPQNAPQSEPLTKDQVQNNAGGYVWEISDWERLVRFLVLGVTSNTYYQSRDELTKDNADVVLDLLKEDPRRVVDMAVDISDSSRAMSNDPMLFVLALAASPRFVEDSGDRKYALNHLSQIARTGSHLLRFVDYVDTYRGWGTQLVSAIEDWYLEKGLREASYQMLKYRNRYGWTHRDILRKVHPYPVHNQWDDLFSYVTQGELKDSVNERSEDLFLLDRYIELQEAETDDEVVRLLQENRELTWEMIPHEFNGSPKVWDQLFKTMPMTASVRNLGRLTNYGLLDMGSKNEGIAVARFTNEEHVRRSRIHPVAVLNALMVYRQGHGIRHHYGQKVTTWTPNSRVVDALEDMYHLSFGNVESTGKRTLLALDVSGSMSAGIGGMALSAREAASVMALVTAKAEDHFAAVAFSDTLITFPLSKKDTVWSVVERTRGVPFGRTDCSLPVLASLQNELEVDTFIIYTDNETWAGRMHPSRALELYRQKMGIPAKLAVVAMTSTGFSIADPKDPGMMDFVGFDTNTPRAISEFVK